MKTEQQLTQKINIRTVAKKVFKKNFVRSVSRDGYLTLVGVRGEVTPQELEMMSENKVIFDRVMEHMFGPKGISWISFYTKKEK